MTVKKMSVNVAKTSKKSRLPVSFLLPRIAIYSAVMAGLMALFYDFQLNTIVPPPSPSKVNSFSIEARDFIVSINKAQQAYYAEHGQFSDSIAKLGIGIKEQTKNYNYTIASSMGPVQTDNHREPAQFESAIAIATFTDRDPGKSYRKGAVFAYTKGAVFAYKEKGSNLIKTISAMCDSDDYATYAEAWSPPTFDGKEIVCRHGTTYVWE